MIKDIEVRNIPVELRADLKTRTIKGTAIVFDSNSNDLGGFVETIKPEAVTQDLINNSDIVMLYNHNQESGVLARSKFGKGSLSISITDTGVDFEFKAKQTPLGDEILQSVLCGDLDACSFAFRIGEDGDSYERMGDKYLRTISTFESLHDFSIVVNPAYSATSVSARSLDKIEELKQKELLVIDVEADEQQRKADADAKEIQFKKYYDSIVNKYITK